MKRPTRTVLIVLGAVVLFAIILIANRSRRPGGESVDTVRAKFGAIRSVVSAIGNLRARDQVNLQAQVMGIVEKLRVREGQWVDRGEVLLELDRRSYEANLVLARSRFTQARLSHVRVESLHARKLIAPEQYEASLAALEMTEAQLAQAQDQFDKTTIRAPISGTVVQVNIKEGEAVMIGTMNNPGTVMMVIADMSVMQALVEVDETDVVEMAVGHPADVEVDALPDRRFPGRVTRLGYMPVQNLLTAASQQGTDFEVEVTLDSSAPSLRPGMSVHAEVLTAELDSVLVIPIQAVGRRETKGHDGETVFLVKDGRAVLTPVRTGRSSATEIEIIEGLSPGDEVISGPYRVLSKLKDGAHVVAHAAVDTAK